MANRRFSVIFEAITDQWMKSFRQMTRSMDDLNAVFNKIDSNSSQAADSMSELVKINSSELGKMTDELRRASNELKSMDDGANVSKNSIKLLGDSVKSTMSDIKVQLAQAKLDFKRLSESPATPEDLNSAKAKIKAIEDSIKSLNDQSKVTKRSLEDAFNESSRKANDLKIKLDDAKKSLNELSSNKVESESIVNARKAVEDLSQELEQVTERSRTTKRQLEDMASESAAKVRQLKTELDEAKKNLTELSKTPIKNDSVIALEKSIQELNEELRLSEQSAKDTKRQLEDSFSVSTDNVKRLKSELAEAKDNLDKLSKSKIPLEDIIKAEKLIDDLNSQLNKTKVESDEAKRSLKDMADQSSEQVRSISRALSDARTNLKRLKEDDASESSISRATKQVRELEDSLKSARKESDAANKALKDGTKESDRAMGDLRNSIKQAQDELKRLKSTGATPDDISEATRKVEQLSDSLKEAESSAQLAGESLKSSSRESARSLEDLKDKIKSAKDELKLLNSTSASPESIIEAERRVKQLSEALNEAEKESREMGESLRSSSKTASREIEDLKSLLSQAKAELKQLNETEATPDDILKAQQSVEELSDALREAQREAKSAGDAIRESAKESSREMEDLRDSLAKAKEELKELNKSGASLEELDEAAKRVQDLENELKLLSNAWDEYRREAENANDRVSDSLNGVGDSADSAGKQIYKSLNIRPATAIIDDINQLNRQLDEFRRQSTAPADEIIRVTRQAETQIRRLQDELRGISDESVNSARGFDLMNSSLGKLATAYLGLDLIEEALRAIVDATSEFERVNKKIEYSAKDMATAADDLEFVRQTARSLGIDVVATGEGFGKLAAATKGTAAEGEITRNVFLGVAQAGATMGLTTENMNGVLLALAQIAGKGRVQMEELRGQLGERLTPAINIAAEGLGVTTAQLIKMVEEGIDAVTFLNAFGPAMQEAFGDSATKNATGLIGTINLLRNEFKFLLNDIGTGAGGAAIITVLTDLRVLIEDVRNSTEQFDPQFVEALTEAFDRMYTTMKDLFSQLGESFADTLKLVDDMANAILVLTGVSEDSFTSQAEKVSFFTRILQGVSVTLGSISDGVYGFRLAMTLATAATIDFGGFLSSILSKVTFGDLSQSLIDYSNELRKVAEEQYANAEKLAMNFESKTKDALDKAVQSSGDKYKQMANEALTELNKIKVGQIDTANEVYQATLKFAEASVKANNGVLDQYTKMVAQQKGYVAELDLSNKVVIKSMDEVYASGEATFKRIQVLAGQTGAAMFNLNVPIEATVGALNQIGQQAGVTFPIAARDAEGMAKTLGMVAFESREASKVISKTLPDAVKELNSSDLNRFSDVFIKGMKDVGVEVEFINKQIRTLAEVQAKQLGANINAALLQTSEGFNKNRESIRELSKDYSELKSAGVDANILIKDALESMLTRAKNPTEVKELIKLWEEMGRTGRVAAKDLADGIDAAKAKLDELTPGINSVEEAFKKLGLTSQRESAKMASTYGEAFNLIEGSGQATSAQLQEAFRKYATAAIAANGGVSNGYLDAKASALGLAVQTDETGRVTVESLNKIYSKSSSLLSMNDQLSKSYESMGNSAVSASAAFMDQLNRQIFLQNQSLEIARQMDELESKRRGANVTSASNLGGTSVAAYSQDNIMKKLLEMGFDNNRARVESQRIFTGWATEFGNKPLWAGGQMSNFDYVNQQLDRLSQYAGGATIGGNRVPSNSNGSNGKSIQVTFKGSNNGSGVRATINADDESNLLRVLEQAGEVSSL